MTDVTLPSLGESVTEGIITQWFKKVGDTVTIVTPNGKREIEILKLTTIHDEAVEEEGETAAGAAQ